MLVTMIGAGKIVLEYFCIAHGRLPERSGIQAKNFKYAEVNHIKVEWHKSVQVEVASHAKVRVSTTVSGTAWNLERPKPRKLGGS